MDALSKRNAELEAQVENLTAQVSEQADALMELAELTAGTEDATTETSEADSTEGAE